MMTKSYKKVLCFVIVAFMVLSASIFINSGNNSYYNNDATVIAETTEEAIETPPPEEKPDPPSIIIQQYPSSMEIGESFKLSYSLRNSDVEKVAWRSDDPDVLSVDSEGRITANAQGTATITAIAGDARDSVSISVREIQAESIKIVSEDFGIADSVTGYSLKRGDTVKLEVEVTPKEATVSGIEWAVDAPEVAEIDEGGTLIALENGTVIVTASAGNDGNLTADIQIQVGSGVPWKLIGIVAAIVLVIIILIILIIRNRRKGSSKPQKAKEDDEEDDDDDGDHDKKMEEAYRRGYDDRAKEMTKIFDPKDFDLKDDDDIE